MKRITVLLFSALILSSGLYATSLKDIFTEAEKNSLTLKNASLNYENNKLNEKANDLKDKVGIKVSTGDISYDKSISIQNTVNHEFAVNPSVEITIPNDGKTVIKAGMGVNANLNGNMIYSPNASVSHTFDFGYKSDSLDSYNDSYLAIQTESVYLKSINSFRVALINQIKNLLNCELSIKRLEKSVSDLETSISNNLELQVYSQNSVSYKKAMLELNKSKANLEMSKKQYENLKARFKNETNIEWNGVENIPSIEITFEPKVSGNSSVVLSSLSLEMASENIKVKESSLNPSSLSLAGGVLSSVENDKKTSYSLSPYLNVNYNIGNIALSSSVNAKVVDNNFSPSLSLSFTWKNNTGSEKDGVEIEKLKNSLIKAQNDYQQDLIAYSESVSALYQKIEEYQIDLEEWKINKEYNNSLLKIEQELLALGLSSEKNVNDILFDIECEELEYQILALDGLLLNLEAEELSI